MTQIDKMEADGTLAVLSKRERLQVSRQRAKLDKNLGSIADMTRLPAAIFIVDVTKEHIALAEAKKLRIPVFAIVDSNSDPRKVDFVIPANDDATKSIDLITRTLAEAVAEGLNERQAEKATADVKSKKADKKEEAPAAEEAPVEEAVAEAPEVEEAPAEEPAAEEVVAEEAPAEEPAAEEVVAEEAKAEK